MPITLPTYNARIFINIHTLELLTYKIYLFIVYKVNYCILLNYNIILKFYLSIYIIIIHLKLLLDYFWFTSVF